MACKTAMRPEQTQQQNGVGAEFGADIVLTDIGQVVPLVTGIKVTAR